jgi:putative membrane protein
MLNTLLSIAIVWLLSALVIYIVGRLNLGMTVSGFGAALIAAAVIAIVSGLLTWLIVNVLGIGDGGGWWGAIVSLVVAAVVLIVSDKFVSGMKVNGFVGAIIAALGIGLVGWLANWLVGLFV